MIRRSTEAIGIILFGLASIGPDQASAHVYIASATGHSSDRSNPLDGIGDVAEPTGDLLNMILNADDPNSGLIADRRGVFEIDMSDFAVHEFLGAFLQFDIFSQNSSLPVNIFLYAGDGVVGADDYARTENLAFSGVLVDEVPQIDVTSQVLSLLGDGQSWIGVLIAMTHEDQVLVIDNVDGRGIDPSITTKIVPEPATIALLGLAGAVGLFRRRPRPS